MTPRRWLAFAALVAAILFAIWLPVGLTASPFTEHWSLHLLLDHGQPWIGVLTPGMGSRPLVMLPIGMAHRAGPDSFASQHVALVLSLAVKAFLVAAVAGRLGCPPALAAASGLLAMIHPGDEGALQGRFMVSHVALDLMLAAILLWLVHLRRRRWYWPLGFWALALASLLMYEVGLALALVAPLLAAFASLARPRRAWWIAAGLWYAAVVGFVAWGFGAGVSYQVAGFGPEPLATRLGEAIAAAARGSWRLLAGSWLDPLLGLATLPGADLGSAAILGVAAAALFSSWSRRDESAEGTGGRAPASMILLGAVVLVAGYAPFALSIAYRSTDVRVYLAAMLGAAPLMVGAAAWVAGRWPRARARRTGLALALGLFVGVATLAALGQQRWILRLSRLEQQLLADILTAAPAPPRGAVILLEDRHGLLARRPELFGWWFTDGHYSDALRLLYGRLDLRPLGWRSAAKDRWAGVPAAQPDGVAVTLDGREIARLGYDRVALFVVGADGRARLSDRLPDDFPAAAQALYAPRDWPSGPWPPRASGFLPLAVPQLPPAE